MNPFVTFLCAVLCSAQALTVNPLSRGYVVFGERLSHVDARVLPFCKQYKCGPASVQQGFDKLSGEPTVTNYFYPLTAGVPKKAQLSLMIDKSSRLQLSALRFIMPKGQKLISYRTLIYRWADSARLPYKTLDQCLKIGTLGSNSVDIASTPTLTGVCNINLQDNFLDIPTGYVGVDLEVFGQQK